MFMDIFRNLCRVRIFQCYWNKNFSLHAKWIILVLEVWVSTVGFYISASLRGPSIALAKEYLTEGLRCISESESNRTCWNHFSFAEVVSMTVSFRTSGEGLPQEKLAYWINNSTKVKSFKVHIPFNYELAHKRNKRPYYLDELAMLFFFTEIRSHHLANDSGLPCLLLGTLER